MILTIQLLLLTAFAHGVVIREPDEPKYGYGIVSPDPSEHADVITGSLATVLGTQKNTIYYAADRHHGVAFLTTHPGVQHTAAPFRPPCLNVIRPAMFAKSKADCYYPLDYPKPTEKYFVPAHEDDQLKPKPRPQGTYFEPFYHM